jgi:hypothetical protein
VNLLYYGMGGGHGHFLRGLAILRRLGTGTILGPARLAGWARACGVGHVASWDAARDVPPDLLLVDVFPRGVVAELGPLLGRCPAWLVTRRVNPGYYLHPPVRGVLERDFERILWSEEPPPGLEVLRLAQERIGPVLLDSLPLSRPEARGLLGLEADGRLVLALGSGDVETQRLQARMLGKVALRLGVPLRFVSDVLEGATCLFPAARAFAAADAIVSAGGYHAFHEIAASGVPAVFLPQDRPLDDQPWRVRGWPVARDPDGLEAVLRALLGGPGARPRVAFEDGALRVARLVERRVKEGVLPEEEVAPVA